MNIDKKENYTLITPTETSHDDFLEVLKISDFEKENLILDFSNSFEITTKQIDGYSEISMYKKENGTSFIIIRNDIEIDKLEDELLSVTPTLTEAEDTLEMDNIERDLGF
ncbi:ribonuclease Z [Flavicella sp.]|uniref:ribonuclease Z n=1 Tax=Flavicella sp. TaxID=2957742 RepID=UPI0030177096